MIPGQDKFKFKEVDEGNKKKIVLQGIIDEDANFASLVKPCESISFNWKEITAINSCGVRSWVNFLKELSGKEVVYEECPTLIVRQMNMVPSFVGAAKIQSVYVPFVCADCETEKVVLVPKDKFSTIANEPPGTCEACGKGEMEFDGHPKQYFSFSK